MMTLLSTIRVSIFLLMMETFPRCILVSPSSYMATEVPSVVGRRRMASLTFKLS